MESGAKPQRVKYIFHAIVVALTIWVVGSDEKGSHDVIVRVAPAATFLLFYFAIASRRADLASAVESFAQVLLLVAALTALATYLSRVYETVKDRSVPQVAI